MLESLTLINFQKHRKRTIIFDPKVTVIVGPTEAGKSSLLRALRWVALNKFDGPADRFINWDAEFAKARLRIDGREVIRSKGKDNRYLLDGETFKAIGAEKVPDEVAKLLQMGAANFQGQLDSHFWFSLPASQVSRELNEIINLSSIDETQRRIAAMARNAKQRTDAAREQLDESRERRKTLVWVPDVAASLSQLETTQKQLDSRASKIASLAASLKNVSESVRTRGRGCIAKEAGFLAVSEAEQLRQTTERIAALSEIVGKLESAQRLPTKLQTRLELCQPLTRAAKLARATGTLRQLIESIEYREQLLDENRATFKTQQTKLGKVCPTCRRPL